ncbi:penicillin-binding protein 1C [Cocleimonas flava]|nr:penicillin-binding protein 1C [Cocleimonas flava]
MKPFKSLTKSKGRSLLFIFVLMGITAFYFCLPEPLFKSPVSSILLSKEGKLLGAHISKDGQWRFPPLQQIPDKFKTSLVAFEDKRFYKHFGVDPLAIARALNLNLKAGRIVSGGSTISMQVIRLASQNPERSLTEKAIEAFRALRLETRYSKDQIMNYYASHAPFGGNVVGLEAASWRYFGRNPQQLSWAESAMLAVLPNSPALIHPGRKRDTLKAKRDRLLLKLFQQEKLSKLDYQLAIAEPLPEKPNLLPRMAPHLLDTLIAKAKANSTENQKRFNTTIDFVLQSQVNQIAKHYGQLNALKDIHNLAIVVIDNDSFEVKAYVGNAPPLKEKTEHGQAIDLIQRPRSTGSTLKPFLFASMIEQGELLPEMLVADAPIRYTGYRPKNFDRKYRGAVRAKQALASSLNIPAVNMLSYHGVERFLATLKNMGMSTLHRRSREYGLPLILGGAEGTLWDLTGMYANLANRAQQGLDSDHDSDAQQGQMLKPIILQEQKAQTSKQNQLSPASAWMTLQALLEVGRPGSEAYWKRFNSTHKIAWKTGTSFGHRDAWALGTTPKYTVGVWVGNAAGEGRQGMTGVKVAAPILFDVFNRLSLDSKWFRKPIEQMKLVSICKDDGFLANQNCEAKDYYIPASSHFDRVSPNHQRIHLDKLTQLRVHSGCESVAAMEHKDWFVLPPDEAYYYQQFHANYKVMPEWREDCQKVETVASKDSPISLIYPRRNTQIYIPKELTGEKGKTVFQAIHGNPEAQLFWHLNDDFLGTTQTYHEQAIWLAAGKHRLTLVDEKGNRVEQSFQVLSQ